MATDNNNGLLLAVARELVCPDGTTFAVYEDGSWKQNTWDGLYVTDSRTHKASVFADPTETDHAAARAEVVAKLGLATS